jgi:hypothetical protein
MVCRERPLSAIAERPFLAKNISCPKDRYTRDQLGNWDRGYLMTLFQSPF